VFLLIDKVVISEYDYSNISLLLYENSVIYLGKIIRARKISRSYRFILNTRIEGKPLYKNFIGAKFGRGIGE